MLSVLCTVRRLLLGHDSGKLPAAPCEHTTEEETTLVARKFLQHAPVSSISSRAGIRGRPLSPEWRLIWDACVP